MSKPKTTNKSWGLEGVLPDKESLNSKKKSFMPQEKIDEIKKKREAEIKFSWRFFDRSHKYFNMGNSDQSWFISLLDVLTNLSCMTSEEFRGQSENRGLRVHSHSWDYATDCFPFSNEWLEQNEQDCLQFGVSQANGRVHGFMIHNVFYIVWLDPSHNLYPPKFRNRKVLEYEYPVTQYEKLEHEYDRLEERYNQLKKDLEACESLLNEYE